MNDPRKRDIVRNYMHERRGDLVCIQETKVVEITPGMVMSCIFFWLGGGGGMWRR